MMYKERKKNHKPIITILWIASLILIYHFGQMRGKVRQMEVMQCVDEATMEQWKSTLNIAKKVCVEVQQNQSDTIEKLTEEKVKIAEDDAKYWKDAYLWLKKDYDSRQDTTTTETEKD